MKDIAALTCGTRVSGGVGGSKETQLVLAVKELALDLWRETGDFGFEFKGSRHNFSLKRSHDYREKKVGMQDCGHMICP